VLGLDIAPSMVAAGDRRAAASGVAHVEFVVHDLQQAPLPQPFDAVFSRFGVMFFTRPEVAFANMVGSLVPGGRLACVVWASIHRNPWMLQPTFAAVGPLGATLDPPPPGEPGPFSLADPAALATLLEDAGLAEVSVTECLGHLEIPSTTAEAEVASMLEIGPLGEAFAAADPVTRSAAIDAVIAAIEPFRAGADWRLPGCALVATGVRPA
jgi:SAM-dependent methyltransferase